MSGGNQTETHNAACRAIREYLVWNGAWEMKALGGLGQRAGVPDILACLHGRFIAIEVKTGAAKLNPAQIRERAGIEQAGAIYILAATVEDVEDRLVTEHLALAGLLRAS